ncbi:MAG TPA: hypothetical protein VMM76_28795 [Pirellulaceae bacterium]|nr:hypothetical protein [Pirellulaceae bacterium]
MQIQNFLDHHRLSKNPFADEDAQTDAVFKTHCLDSIRHPAWDKVYGDPAEPATAIVFGEKGAGKTAVRLQLARQLAQYNLQHPGQRVLVIHYDDFNPFLDRFRDHVGKRRARIEKTLAQWKLWDHMDAILQLAVTGVVDAVLDARSRDQPVECDLKAEDIDGLSRDQSRDLLLLAACYDQSLSGTFRHRWSRLRQRLRFSIWRAWLPWVLGCGVSALVIGLLGYLSWHGFWGGELSGFQRFLRGSVLLIMGGTLLGAWYPWVRKFWTSLRLARGMVQHTRVGIREASPLRGVLGFFTRNELSGQPLPNKERTDDRYELLAKLQALLQTLGYNGIVVLVDRLDEPHLINGSAELMKLLLWPMLDNKFLKHAGLGLKLMLPSDLTPFVEREDKSFYERSRLDKQNMIRSFHWTGEALYDVANARLRGCAGGGAPVSLRDWFEDGVTDQRLMDAMRSLATPRHLFKFLYRLLVAHCNTHLDDAPNYQISTATFEANLALYLREKETYDRGLGAI